MRFSLPLLLICTLLSCGSENAGPLPNAITDPKAVLKSEITNIPKSDKLGSYDDKAVLNTPQYEVVGKEFPNFSYYDLQGNYKDFYSELNKGKAILVASGSYSCPVFRRRIGELNQFSELYGNELRFLVIYTVEAHPVNVSSPYRDSIWVHKDNYAQKVFIDEAGNMQQRIKNAKALAKRYLMKTELGIDGPDNEFWLNYGQMPAFAYLVDTDKKIKAFHEWFYPPDMTKHIYEVRKSLYE